MIKSQTSKLSKLILSMLTLGVVVIAIQFAFRPAPQIFDEPLTEDGYYAQTIARNIGTGYGFTIDRQQLTNGTQPLWVFSLFES